MTTIGVFAAIFDEQGRILCVKRGYGPKNWTTPGGRMDPGETPTGALVREVREETGFIVKAGQLIGVYSAPLKDDLVLSIEAAILSKEDWCANEEITEYNFFEHDSLPEPMTSRTRLRIMDAFERKSGVVREFTPDS